MQSAYRLETRMVPTVHGYSLVIYSNVLPIYKAKHKRTTVANCAHPGHNITINYVSRETMWRRSVGYLPFKSSGVVFPRTEIDLMQFFVLAAGC